MKKVLITALSVLTIGLFIGATTFNNVEDEMYSAFKGGSLVRFDIKGSVVAGSNVTYLFRTTQATKSVIYPVITGTGCTFQLIGPVRNLTNAFTNVSVGSTTRLSNTFVTNTTFSTDALGVGCAIITNVLVSPTNYKTNCIYTNIAYLTNGHTGTNWSTNSAIKGSFGTLKASHIGEVIKAWIYTTPTRVTNTARTNINAIVPVGIVPLTPQFMINGTAGKTNTYLIRFKNTSTVTNRYNININTW
jgi:hypothetical protein